MTTRVTCCTPPSVPAANPYACLSASEGKCIDMVVNAGYSFSYQLVISELNKNEVLVTGYTPGLPGFASLTLADTSCVRLDDCLFLYGVCDDACEPVTGYYTITAINGNVVSVAEQIAPGEPSELVPFRPRAALAAVTVDLTNVEFTMTAYTRGGKKDTYGDVKASAQINSNMANITPVGSVSLYDVISIPDLGITDARVTAITPAAPGGAFDTITFDGLPTTADSACAPLTGKSGIITPFYVDRSSEVCGTIDFYLNPEGETVTNPDSSTTTYLGTEAFSDIRNGLSYEVDNCDDLPGIGYYSIDMRYTDPVTNREEVGCVLQGFIYAEEDVCCLGNDGLSSTLIGG